MDQIECDRLLDHLRNQENELQWLEFKTENYNLDMIGECISALSNGARLHDREEAYLVFGISNDRDHKIVGVKNRLSNVKKGGEELEHWLLKMLAPKLHFKIVEFVRDELLVCMVIIPATSIHPTKFKGSSYIRIGSYTKKLSEYPEKEKILWKKIDLAKFEQQTAKEVHSLEEVFSHIDVTGLLNLFNLPVSANRNAILDKMISENLVNYIDGNYRITNLGAILFAKDLNDFAGLANKTLRVVLYDGTNRVSRVIKDIIWQKGYAVGFEGLIKYINDQLPVSEVIEKAIR